MSKKRIPIKLTFSYKFVDSPDTDKRLRKLIKLLMKKAPKKESFRERTGLKASVGERTTNG